MRWLHLSDFHFRADVRWQRRATLEALLRWAEAETKAERGPDLVFLTGDVAWSGRRAEYDQARDFFAKLAEATALDPIERFFVVPGNHDVDRTAIGPRDDRLVRDLDDQDEIESILRDAPTMKLLGRRLEEFYAFTERFLGAARAYQPDRPWRVDLRKVAGVDVALVQLNSAWASGKDDDTGKPLVGEAQVREALAVASAAPMRIALIHHPVADLAYVDRARLETLLPAAGGVHVLLRGHLHRGRVVGASGPHGEMIEMAAGTVYTDGRWPRGFFQAELDLEAGKLRSRFFTYSDEGRGFWTTDSGAIEGRPDGTWEQPLPASLRAGSAAAETAVVVATEKRRQSVASRYRAAVAAVHGTVRFVGFADARPRRNLQVPELFVPLRVRSERLSVAIDESWTTAELLSRFVARREAPARFVVLGDPGSGKTTLCRFFAVVLSGEASVEGVEVHGEPLPLFLPFRDYVRRRREEGDCDLVTYLAEQARNHLHVTLTVEDLKSALEARGAFLLLDGLDEVGAAAEREDARERVQAFCRAWDVPVLVTSRVAGYDEAPLPDGPGGFRLRRLEPFNDADLEQFVVRWYSAQEPEDPSAREEGIADLRAALAANARVRELARNPMLATLIALVHRFEAHLPGERAKLYDLCIKTLLETWPAASKRRFDDVDEGLQRAYLEEVAYELQQKRSNPYGEVMVERGNLGTMLTAIVARDRGVREEIACGLVERWVAYLEEGTGLLVEQRPGVFAFLHLSLMEYLAARGWDRATDLVEGIAEKWSEPEWREVCLLAIGSRATDRGFLDRLFEQLTAVESDSGVWGFLLAALGEEASFDESQCGQIAAAAAESARKHGPRSDAPERFNSLRILSRRHREWAERWIGGALAVWRSERLIGAVVLAGFGEGTVTALRRRPDHAAAAGDLLDLGPSVPVGHWAHGTASPAARERWHLATPEELVPLRGLFAFSRSDSGGPGPAAAAISRSTLRVTRLTLRAISELAPQERPGGQGLPARIESQPGNLDAIPLPSLRVVARPGEVPAAISSLRLASDIGFIFARDVARDFSRDFVSVFSGAFARDFALDLTFGFASAGGEVFISSIADAFTPAFASAVVSSVARGFLRDLARTSARGFSLDFVGEIASLCRPPTRGVPAPSSKDLPADLAARPRWTARVEPLPDELVGYAPLLLSRLAIETWVALATTVERPVEEKYSYLARRLQNSWLLHIWPALDELLDRDSTPDRLALYLTLGWSQATTTWLWPGTPRWIQILGGPPPAEWAPRAAWHLCWLLHDPEGPTHVAGLRAALAEGKAENPDDVRIEAFEEAAGLASAG